MQKLNSVAIIGGGPSGIVTLHELIGSGINDIVLFERLDSVGGLWNCDNFGKQANLDKIWEGKTVEELESSQRPNWVSLGEGHYNDYIKEDEEKDNNKEFWYSGGVYPRMYTNVPDKYMTFSFAPCIGGDNNNNKPFRLPSEVNSYLHSLVSNSPYKEKISLCTRVDWIEKFLDSNGCRKWNIYWTQTKSEKLNLKYKHGKSTFDGVVIGSGHFHVPKVPFYKGLSESAKFFIESNGKYGTRFEHSINYRADIEKYKNKKILIVGNSFSAIDCIRDLSKVASKPLELSHRSDSWFAPWLKKASEIPNLVKHRKGILFFIPPSLSNSKDLCKEKLENDMKCTVVFNDGSKGTYDVILFSTGYYYHYPFLGSNIEISRNGNRVMNLYKEIFTINEPTLSFVGLANIFVVFRALEVAAAAIASVYSGKVKLPPVSEQKAWEHKREVSCLDPSKFHIHLIDEVNWFFEEIYAITKDENHRKIFNTHDNVEKSARESMENSLTMFYNSLGIDVNLLNVK